MKLYVAIVTLVGVVMGVASLKNVPKEYIDLARKAADQYMAGQAKQRSSERELGHHHSPTKKTLAMLDEQERREAELKALVMLAYKDDNTEAVRALETLENENLFTRAEVDPVCSQSVTCDDSQKLQVDGIEFRTFDGICNNEANHEWGMVNIQHVRELDNDYDNGKWAFRNKTFDSTKNNLTPLPNARAVSDAVHAAGSTSRAASQDFTLALFQWGQFLDHDVISTPNGRTPVGWECCTDSSKRFCMVHYAGENDSIFPQGHCFASKRSATVLTCDEGSQVQNQINELTATIDASHIYGNSKEESDTLRSFEGGKLSTSTSDFLPFASDPSTVSCDEEQRKDENAECFLAGDSRVNVQPGLSTFHTIFVRLHNHIVEQLKDLASTAAWSDDRFFQEGRKIVGAIMQHITYEEFLPVLLDPAKLTEYGVSTNYAYNDTLNPSIFQSFTMAFRFHNMIPDKYHQTTLSDSSPTNSEEVAMETTWNDPSYLYEHDYDGMGRTALGLVFNACPHANRAMDNSARQHLFMNKTTTVGFDLASMNIMRGREWGMNAYTEWRTLAGLSDVTTWEGLTDHSAAAITALQSTYSDPRDIDPWTGFVSEDPIGDSFAGPTQTYYVANQFKHLKHGDRFWYEGTAAGFSDIQRTELKKITLARVLCDTLQLTMIPKEVFKVSTAVSCSTDIESFDYNVFS